MFNSFLRLTFRNLLKHKGFASINIIGLAIGLATSLLIVLWIQDELSYEKFNSNAENIYRVEEDQFYSGERYHVTVTPHPSGPVWKEKIPEIVEQTRINRLPRILFRQGETVFFESSVIAADSGLFKVFTLPMVLGDPQTVLSSPHSIVLTEKLAKKYFGDENPLGKTLTLENKLQFMVTGVMRDLPHNSIFTFEGVIPYSFLSEIGAISDSWGNNSIFTFVVLEKGSDIQSVNKKLTDVVLEYLPQTLTKYLLFPLLDIHLHSQFGYEISRGPVIVIYIFTLVAVFVLLIACFNFINLSTAKASGRSKEIGIKKVTGAGQKTLIVQFMIESLFLVSVAMLFALFLIGLALPLFNNISGKNFILHDLLQFRFIISVIIVGFAAGIISGIYPALYLSSFKPVAVLKGETVSGKANGRLRQILVVIQFMLSILIAIAAIFMYMQLKHLQNKDLGFDKENLICIPMLGDMLPKYYPLKEELLKQTLIDGVTAARSNPVRIGSNSGGADWEGRDPERRVLIGTNVIDYDYLKTMKMELKSGRDFSRDFPSDIARDTTGNFLINEEVAKIMGVDDPVGMSFSFMGIHGRIVGLLKNFHFKGADEPVEPIAFALTGSEYLSYILIRLASGNIPDALKKAEEVWNKVIPEYPFNYTFIDEDYDNLFRGQIRLTTLLKYFTILAMIIACLGLYGLSAYSAERRTNEIGIRKVMGAGTATILYTMAKEFMLLILISLAIALPAGWIIVENLLKQFASRIDMSIFVFAGIAAGAIVIAIVTVSFQAFKASRINPAEALKVE
ncbi:MAG TPA: ABC transporter permease [Bacteroidales bacterium]|nr:ABC transporter permease [Bacteroidales bacterium]